MENNIVTLGLGRAGNYALSHFYSILHGQAADEPCPEFYEKSTPRHVGVDFSSNFGGHASQEDISSAAWALGADRSFAVDLAPDAAAPPAGSFWPDNFSLRPKPSQFFSVPGWQAQHQDAVGENGRETDISRFDDGAGLATPAFTEHVCDGLVRRQLEPLDRPAGLVWALDAGSGWAGAALGLLEPVADVLGGRRPVLVADVGEVDASAQAGAQRRAQSGALFRGSVAQFGRVQVLELLPAMIQAGAGAGAAAAAVQLATVLSPLYSSNHVHMDSLRSYVQRLQPTTLHQFSLGLGLAAGPTISTSTEEALNLWTPISEREVSAKETGLKCNSFIPALDNLLQPLRSAPARLDTFGEELPSHVFGLSMSSRLLSQSESTDFAKISDEMSKIGDFYESGALNLRLSKTRNVFLRPSETEFSTYGASITHSKHGYALEAGAKRLQALSQSRMHQPMASDDISTLSEALFKVSRSYVSPRVPEWRLKHDDEY